MYYRINKGEYILRILLKLIAIASSMYGVFYKLSPIAMTYFTQQSNIFIAIVLFIFMIMDIITLATNGRKNYRPQYLYIIKFMATICITLTFFVFAFILAPLMGSFMNAYFMFGNATSFCMHFLTPILALIDFFLFDDQFKGKAIYSLYAVVPPLCYVGYILVMYQVFHYDWNGMAAPYNFLNYIAPCGWFGFDLGSFSFTTVGIGVAYMMLLLIIIFVILGSFFIWINRKLHPQRRYHY